MAKEAPTTEPVTEAPPATPAAALPVEPKADPPANVVEAPKAVPHTSEKAPDAAPVRAAPVADASDGSSVVGRLARWFVTPLYAGGERG